MVSQTAMSDKEQYQNEFYAEHGKMYNFEEGLAPVMMYTHGSRKYEFFVEKFKNLFANGTYVPKYNAANEKTKESINGMIPDNPALAKVNEKMEEAHLAMDNILKTLQQRDTKGNIKKLQDEMSFIIAKTN